MSKLYSNYLELKRNNSSNIYLFKSGVFYIALANDAIKLSEEFGFKITNLNEQVVKCGFPTRSLETYATLLQNHNIPFEIVDLHYSKIDNYSDYLNNSKLKNVVKTLKEVDINNITFKAAFELLHKLSEEVKKIYNI